MSIQVERHGEHLHAAVKKLFQLRASLISERLRVEKVADVVTWNALDVFTEHCNAMHCELIKHMEQIPPSDDNDPVTAEWLDLIRSELNSLGLCSGNENVFADSRGFYISQRLSPVILKFVKTRGEVRLILRALGEVK